MSDVGAPGPLGSPDDEGDLDPSFTSSYEPTGARTDDAEANGADGTDEPEASRGEDGG